MKITKLKLGVLGLITVPFLMGCPKPTKNMAPQLDEELQSSIDASFATFVVTDIEMLCSFMGEDDLSPDFYLLAPGEDESKLPGLVRNFSDEKIVAPYNNNAACVDGVVRNGSVFLYFGLSDNQNAKYYRDYDFKGRIHLDSYKTNGWLVENLDGKDCLIYNQLSSSTYDPSVTNITWLIDGSFKFTHPTDPSKNMIWTGKITKTLKNTNDKAVFDPSKHKTINWSKAIVAYSGDITGLTSSDVPYKMSINKINPLVRDFSCYPNVIGGIESAQPLKTWKEEFHPFTSGIATLTTGEKYPREIYFGNEDNKESDPQCDNSGTVLIKGVSYSVDFKK